MHLDLMRDKARAFPFVADPQAYTSARVWGCNYSTLGPLARFTGFRSLRILGYPDPSFDLLAALVDLDELEVTHLPKVTEINALGELPGLTKLELATLPSWDSSGKVTEPDSLRWLASRS